MSVRSLMYLFAVALRHKITTPPTKHQRPGKHHSVHAGPVRATGQKLARQCRRHNLIRGH